VEPGRQRGWLGDAFWASRAARLAETLFL